VGSCGLACTLWSIGAGDQDTQFPVSAIYTLEPCPLACGTTMRWHPRMSQLHRHIKTQARYAYSQEDEFGMSYVRESGLPTPRQVKQHPHPRGDKS
jgi:hypothetical protein